MINRATTPQGLVTPMAANGEDARLIWPQGSLGEPPGDPMGGPAGGPGLIWPRGQQGVGAEGPAQGMWGDSQQGTRQTAFLMDRAHSIAGPGAPSTDSLYHRHFLFACTADHRA